MPLRNSIHIVAPSFIMPYPELELGVGRLRADGFQVKIDRQCRKKHFYLAGDDDARAQALFDAAHGKESELIWCARGGYGAGRILERLEKLTLEKGVPPKKVLAGYSDTTALYNFVRERWGWSVLHSPMPGFRGFCLLPTKNWEALTAAISGNPSPEVFPWHGKKLKFFGSGPTQAIEAELVGGNLSVWAGLIGSRFAGSLRGKMFFVEDVEEPLYRLDRYMTQLDLSGALEGAKAIIVGHHEGCFDRPGKGLKKVPSERSRDRVIREPKPSEVGFTRSEIPLKKGLEFVYGSIGQRLGIPVAYGLPVGHGSAGQFPLPMSAHYRLSPSGNFEILEWDGWAG